MGVFRKESQICMINKKLGILFILLLLWAACHSDNQNNNTTNQTSSINSVFR